MKRLRLTAALAAMLLAGCTSGTYVSQDQQSGFQKGVTTQAQVEAELGTPTSTGSLVSGGHRDVYVYHDDSSRPLGYVPLLGLVATGWPHTTTVNFDFNTQGVLIDSTSRTVRG